MNTTPITCTVGVAYASYCPHCHSLVGEKESDYENSDWFRLKNLLENHTNHKGTKYTVEKIESQEAGMNGLKEKGIVVNGFPTIYKYYGSGENVEYYNGERTVDSIKKWATNHSNRFGKGFKFMLGGRRKRTAKRMQTRTQRRKRRNVSTRKMK